MPPKVKITKEEIVEAAVDILRQSGVRGLNARTVAAALGCSTQPVFSNFATMDALDRAVLLRVNGLCEEYIQRETESGEYPVYKASGMAYIRFAKEEKELFRYLYMRDRTEDPDFEKIEFGEQMETIVQEHTGLNGAQMKLFHLEMWAFVHGIATMFATGFLDLDWALVSQMLTNAYQGLRRQYGLEV
ncbi:MAG: WHG domain-containing protein [Clostridia bacterium]|nr:WHG domain-containing protein [Clostridia bacterium]